MGYTRRQIRLFHREAELADRAARADRIEDIGAAMSRGGGKFLGLLRRR